MSNPTHKERWWSDDNDIEDFSTWFDKEYGKEFQAVGVISSALCHEKMMPFGSDASYMTKNLERIFKERESQTIRDIMEWGKKNSYRISASGQIVGTCDVVRTTDLLSHLEGLLAEKK